MSFGYYAICLLFMPDIRETLIKYMLEINFHKNASKRPEFKLKIFNLMETDERTEPKQSIMPHTHTLSPTHK